MKSLLRSHFIALVVLALGATAVYAAVDGPRDGKAQYVADVAQEQPAWAAEASEAASTSAECVDGMAAVFPCENIDLDGFVSLAELGGATGNDVWGWVDPANGDEYAIVGTSNGTTFVDVTDPVNPEVVGTLVSQSVEGLPLWRDIKVHDNHAFIVSEHSDHGMQVFDLRRLRVDGISNVDVPTRTFLPDATYFGQESDPLSNSHNISINEETGFAYLVGTNTCAGGLHMVDVSAPATPTFAGCFAEDGYTHDVECEVYDGPDAKHRGSEICFASNEDTVTIVDVTDKDDPEMLSRTGYDSAAYTHQGDLTPDQGWFLFGDELDEQSGTVDNTTTYIQDVSDLDAPATPVAYAHDSQTIDHNLYVDDRFVWEANYNEGLSILEYDDSSLAAGELDEVASFDVVPAVDVSEFAGAWSNYDYPSGTVVVSALETGLFVLDPDLPEATDDRRDDKPGKGNGHNRNR